jgi:hypothetical protein
MRTMADINNGNQSMVLHMNTKLTISKKKNELT